ncbi:helix-turn-helix transcriptional regulator [Microbulbifer taiwanensis]|uniref:Helix-turn-helix transcriptional regulator n=1 Tax=Microbulbifer taiwanensis TaxID=986746 RepID=A0ABW1YNF7_9GAMM|nr:transcriptional regulator [Microbulbifer taiwanensis]
MQKDLSQPPTVNPAAMYRAPECARLFGIGLSTWWNWTKTGRAQRGIKLGPKTTVWEGSYLLELKRELIAEAQC